MKLPVIIDGKTAKELEQSIVEFMDKGTCKCVDLDVDPLGYMAWHLMIAAGRIVALEEELAEKSSEYDLEA